MFNYTCFEYDNGRQVYIHIMNDIIIDIEKNELKTHTKHDKSY